MFAGRSPLASRRPFASVASAEAPPTTLHYYVAAFAARAVDTDAPQPFAAQALMTSSPSLGAAPFAAVAVAPPL